ncbi:MAG: response regulator [Alishewanella sp.]|nr:response regulator [Alishewanella sp.]
MTTIIGLMSLFSVLMIFLGFAIGRQRHTSALDVAGNCSESKTAIQNALLHSNLSAIVVIDKGDKILEFNPCAEMLFKRQRQHVLGLTMAELIMPERYRQKQCAGMKHYLETGMGSVLKKRIEVRALNAQGDEFPIEMEITPIDSANGTIFVAVINDITEREHSRKKIVDALAQAEEANKAKSLFLTSVSHEIRTPLHAVLSLIECLQHTALSDLQLEYVSAAQQAGDRLLNMVNDILELGQIESGKREVHFSWCRPKALLEQHLEVYRQSLAEKGLELYLIEAGNGPKLISTDVSMLQQILSNLLSNACKYTESGGVTVHSWCQEETLYGKPERWWCCDVIDTGISLTEEQMKSLFQEFTRLHQDGSSSGSGVGLMISRLLAEQLGGSLSVHSNKEAGTTFRLSLPIAHVRPKRQFKQLQQLIVFLYSDNPRWLNCMMQQLVNLGVTQQEIVTADTFGLLPDDAIVIVDTQKGAVPLPFNPLVLSEEQQHLRIISAGDDYSAALAACPRHFAFINQPYRRQDIIAALRAAQRQRSLTFNSVRMNPPQIMLSPPQTRQAFHILLVDDSEVNRLTIKTFLGLEGMRVTEASNGQEAINAVRDTTFDLILMDMRMPVMDGIEAAQLIRSQQLAKGTPIIALTAHVQETEKQRCLEAGMQDFLTKPIGKSMLIKRLLNWLPKHRTASDREVFTGSVDDTSTKLFDEKLLMRLKQDIPPAKFKHLLEVFLSEMEKSVSQINSLLNQQNFTQIEILVHAIKSSANMFGAIQMSNLALSIETACQEQQLARVAEYCALMDDMRQQTEIEFKRFGFVR